MLINQDWRSFQIRQDSFKPYSRGLCFANGIINKPKIMHSETQMMYSERDCNPEVSKNVIIHNINKAFTS